MKKTPSPVLHAHLRKVLLEAGARRLADEPLQRSDMCALETWMFPRMPSRLLLIQHCHRNDSWEHFIQGADAGTDAAIEEILAVFGDPRQVAGEVNAEVSEKGGWSGIPF